VTKVWCALAATKVKPLLWLSTFLLLALGCSAGETATPDGEPGIERQSLVASPAPTSSPAPAPAPAPSGKAAEARTVWVLMKEQPNFAQARAAGDWNTRGQRVYGELTTRAASSQASLLKFLRDRGLSHKPFWIVNTVRVTAAQAAIDEIARRPDVDRIVADQVFYVPPITKAAALPRVDSVEWGLSNIRAPEVWDTFDARGDGIVIANIDTGVQFDHPALVNQYRGNDGSGQFDHNYNWFDPSSVCGSPSNVPCDNAGHGTHTMGTMVGDDGAGNQIGVAPHATWIAAKGCESFFCSNEALLAAGQWIIAPTDLSGQNPRPDLRPHIVNNSWGDGPGNDFYRSTVQAWVEAGIFPVFSIGNWQGSPPPPCASAGSPGDYPESYGVGAYDINNVIADFSLRGPSFFDGITKPNIAAPGVAVRSSVPGNSYELFSGTSMAAPHVAGTIALLWSAAPTLERDLDSTRALLDQAAVDTADSSCGGGADNNNVWGQGRLDAFVTVEEAPRGPSGVLAGVVTDVSSGQPIPGASVRAQGGERDRVSRANASGAFRMVLGVGTYTVSATAFGYLESASTSAEISEGVTTTQDFALALAPTFPVTGTVTDEEGTPIAGAKVTLLSTPIAPVTTDASGAYGFADVPAGSYDVQVEAGTCLDGQTIQLVVDADETLDFVLTRNFDAFGYGCSPTTFDFIEANEMLPLFGDDSVVEVPLPFPFDFYGQTYQTAFVSTNGNLNFSFPDASYSNQSIPNVFPPNTAIYALWDDLFVDGGIGTVRTEVVGSAPNRQFVIEWRDVAFLGTSLTTRFEIVLSEDGKIVVQYHSAGPDPQQRGAFATTGIENETGTIALQYSFNQPVLESGQAIRYELRPSGFIEGTVTSGGTTVPGATIEVVQNGEVIRTVTADENGHYRTLVPIGEYSVRVRAFGYEGTTIDGVVVNEDEITFLDVPLVKLPAFSVSGYVTDQDGNPLAGVSVSVLDTPLAVVSSDANGFYLIPSVPIGEYSVQAAVGGCYDSLAALVSVQADVTQDFTLTQRFDAFGYSCQATDFAYVEANTILPIAYGDGQTPVTLPFPFVYYGKTFDTLFVTTNGFVQFSNLYYPTGFNDPIPYPFSVNNAIFAFWDQLYVDELASVRTEVVGAAPDRRFVIEWRNVVLLETTQFGPGLRVSFELVLSETGEIVAQYQSVEPDPLQRGGSATIGLENENGTDGLQFSFNQPLLHSGQAVAYNPLPSGIVYGTITDANDGLVLGGAEVRVRASDGTVVRSTASRSDGTYLLQVPVGPYTIEATRSRYSVESTALDIAEGEFYERNFALRSALASISPATIQLTTTANQIRRRTLTLSNTGTLGLEFTVGESGGTKQAISAPQRLASSASLASSSSATARALSASTWNTRDLFQFATSASALRVAPTATGDVLKTFTPSGLGLAWGVGYSGNVWLSDVFQFMNHEYTPDGLPTGTAWSTPWAAFGPADMAFDPNRNLMCQVNRGGDNGIYCWDPGSGSVVDSITGPFPWTQVDQLALAYRSDDDSFYIGGWNEGVVYHVRGLSHASRGEVLGTCRPSDGAISGLAYNASADVLWMATNSPTDTIYELNPDDCTTLGTLAHPAPGFNAGGLEMDEDGNLWMISQFPNQAYLVESGVPVDVDVPWLSVSPVTGAVAPGASLNLSVTVNTQGLAPGLYLGNLAVRTNAPKNGVLRVPVSLVVSSYQQGIEVGSNRAYTDTLGDTWTADQKHRNGSWGYIQSGRTVNSNRDISGTVEDKLYQTQRVDPYAYRFDNVPNGVYEVDFRFAELDNVRPGKRLYDVIIENTLVLPAHDVRYEVGRFVADDHVFFIEVTDRRMDVRLVPRSGFDVPSLGALRITHRPDR
jgi:subtilisin family serine protease